MSPPASAVAKRDVQKSVFTECQPAAVMISLRLIHRKKNVLAGCVHGIRIRRCRAKFRNCSLQGAIQASSRVVDVEAAVRAVTRMKSKPEQTFLATGHNQAGNIEIRRPENVAILNNLDLPALLDDKKTPRAIAGLLNVQRAGETAGHRNQLHLQGRRRRGRGGGVVEPPLQPKQTSDTHKLRTVPIRNHLECFACIVPPQPCFSILPKGIILRRVILRRDLSTILGRAASKSVLWQNRKFIELIYGTPYNPGRRATRKSAQDGQEARSWWCCEVIRQRRTRAHFRRLPPLGLSGSNTRSPRLVRTPETSALEALTGEVAAEARRIYCGTVGADFTHLPELDRQRWIAARIEAPAQEVNQQRILERLIRADLFEQVLQARYLGTKRFSLEGVTALIPLLDSILETAGEHGALESVMAMSHRGRLNVMVHAACKTPHEVVAGFEDVDPRSVLGAGDVKYHVGATGTYVTTNGKKIGIHLVSNPSHLEAVDPVAVGRARAKQTRYGLRGPYVDRSPET